MSRPVAWLPAFLMGVGALFTVGVNLQRALPLREPLTAAVPLEMAGGVGVDAALSEEEARVAGVTAYLLRSYEPRDTAGGSLPFSVYVGYYDGQTNGKTIHSPKNCLPGAGWEALASTRVQLETSAGPVQVNRYLLQNKEARALVLYWYQGRGRVEGNEYRVKWDLLRDAALRQRSDEALVRIVVPLGGGEERAFNVAAQAAALLIPAVYNALPS
jgi:EpsI family protein